MKAERLSNTPPLFPPFSLAGRRQGSWSMAKRTRKRRRWPTVRQREARRRAKERKRLRLIHCATERRRTHKRHLSFCHLTSSPPPSFASFLSRRSTPSHCSDEQHAFHIALHNVQSFLVEQEVGGGRESQPRLTLPSCSPLVAQKRRESRGPSSFVVRALTRPPAVPPLPPARCRLRELPRRWC